MKKEYGFLIAAGAFIIGGLFILFSEMDKQVVFGGAMCSLGVAFVAVFANKRKKEREK